MHTSVPEKGRTLHYRGRDVIGWVGRGAQTALMYGLTSAVPNAWNRARPFLRVFKGAQNPCPRLSIKNIFKSNRIRGTPSTRGNGRAIDKP